MHIVLLNDDALPFARGGAAVVVDRLRRELASRGHRVTLVTTHQDPSSGGLLRTRDEAGETISIFRVYPLRERHRRCLRDSAMSSSLRSLFADLRPDVVHAHNIHSYLTYQALKMAREHTEQVLLTAHDTFLVSFGRVVAPKRLHWGDHLAAAGRSYWPLRNTRIRNILRSAGARVTALSDVQRKFLETNGIRVDAVIPNGVELPSDLSMEEVSRFRQRHSLKGPTILFGGRISADKGIEALLSALPRIRAGAPDAQCLILGDAHRARPFLSACDAEIRSMVLLSDYLPHDEMRLAYSAADVVTTPSLYLDSFNIMNIEAMAASKPVVGSVFGAGSEIIVDSVTGFVRDPRSPAYAEALASCLRDPALAKKMGEAGRIRAEEKFSLSLQADRFLALYSS